MQSSHLGGSTVLEIPLKEGITAKVTIYRDYDCKEQRFLGFYRVVIDDQTYEGKVWVYAWEEKLLDGMIILGIRKAIKDYYGTPYGLVEQATDSLVDLWPYSEEEVRLGGCQVPLPLPRLSSNRDFAVHDKQRFDVFDL